MSATPSRTSMRAPSPMKRPLRDHAPPTPSISPAPQLSTPGPRQLRRPMSMMSLSSTGARPSLGPTLRSPGPGFRSPGPNSPPTYKGTIQVAVRTKPEPNASNHWIINKAERAIISNQVSDLNTQLGEYVFDSVFDGDSTNSEVFTESVSSLIGKVVEGYNATMFAYGMTGSGKTFSMQGTDTDPGIIPRSAKLLFDQLNAGPTDHVGGLKHQVTLSYLEIYNERINDLLRAGPSEVTLRDDPVTGVRAVGLLELPVANAQELVDAIARGDQMRRTSSTQFNERSSRSHAVVQITTRRGDQQSQLFLCDLAGSERAVSELERRKEGSFINKSLLTLGTVISRLSQGGGGHVPYRDSKLTRLLQPSLSGNAVVSVLCTVQLLKNSLTETSNTLRFAARAKNITVNAKRTSIFDGDSAANDRYLQIIDQQRQEIASLRSELAREKQRSDDAQGQLDIYLGMADDAADDSLESVLALRGGDQNGRLQEQVSFLQTENKSLHDQVGDLLQRMQEASHEFEMVQSRISLQSADKNELLAEIDELKETVRDRDHMLDFYRGQKKVSNSE